MSTGALLLPPGYHPLIAGAVVPGGKLQFYRSGTVTPQDTYTDSTLSTPNANPVILNATGGLDTLVYGDPTTGFKYEMRILSSADAELDAHPDLVVWGADTATLSEGSFTGTLTGMSGATTGTINYRIVANSAGVGKVVHIYNAGAAITGTSNTTAMTMTGLPAAIQTSATQFTSGIHLTDNGNSVQSIASVNAGTMTFYTDDPLLSIGFENTGTKGIPAGWYASYPLV